MTRRKDPDEIKLRISKLELIEIIEDTVGQLDYGEVHWLSEEEYQKAVTQLRMNVVGIFDFMRVDDKLPVKYMYGLGTFINGAIDEIVKLTEAFGLRVRGIDKPINLEEIRRKALTNIGKENIIENES
jgi:hypothetical protein